MKIREKINEIDKEWLYDQYTRLVEDFKDYEKINCEEILEEILNIYKDYNNIISLCQEKELETLEKILKKKKIKDEETIEELHNKLFIWQEKNKYVIPEEIKYEVKKAIKNVRKTEKHAIDSLNESLIGMCKIYGIISPEKIYEIINDKIKIQKEVILNIIEQNRYFKYFTYKIEYDEKEYIIYEPFHYFEEELVETLELYKEIEYKKVSLEEMINHRYNLLDLKKESIRKFIEKLNEYNIDIKKYIENIIEYSVLDIKRDNIIKEILKEPNIEKKEEIIYLLEKAMDDMPSAALKGYTPNEMTQLLIKKEYDKNYHNIIEKTKENETIKDYKSLREETDEMFNNCAYYLMNHHKNEINNLIQVAHQNEIFYSLEDTNILNNLIFFHQIEDNGECLFSKYVKNGINVLSRQYKIAWQVEENKIESLFEVKKLNPEEGTIIIIDTKTKKEYLIYDIAFSCGNKNMEGGYIYTTITNVNKISFANGYAFVFLKDFHQNIIKELEEIKNTIINVKNNSLKTFFACHKLFQKENIVFTAKPLE